MEVADRVAPILAANGSLDEAPDALQALVCSEHVGRITVTVRTFALTPAFERARWTT
jgi:hypothetical protein